MKIIGICGSPKKKNSTTMFALQKAMDTAGKEGFDTEIISLAEYDFKGCGDCGFCREKLGCSQKDDFTQKIIPLLDDEQIKGMIFASPVYFGGVTSQMKAFMDRCVPFRRNGYRFAPMIAGAISVGRSRNGGQELTTMDIVKNCMIHGMTVVPDAPPTSHFGGNMWSGVPDGINTDAIGIQTAENLGRRVAEIAKKIN